VPHAAPGRALIARLLLAVALASPWPAAAALYKWVDEKGVTHYSEQPPPDGKATRLELPAQAPAQGSASPGNWKEREIEFRKHRIEKEQADDKQKADSERNAAMRKDACLRARRQLDLLGAGRPLYHVNEHGERVYMDDAERAAETKKWSKEAEAACD
jgi:hypothetical protein